MKRDTYCTYFVALAHVQLFIVFVVVVWCACECMSLPFNSDFRDRVTPVGIRPWRTSAVMSACLLPASNPSHYLCVFAYFEQSQEGKSLSRFTFHINSYFSLLFLHITSTSSIKHNVGCIIQLSFTFV